MGATILSREEAIRVLTEAKRWGGVVNLGESGTTYPASELLTILSLSEVGKEPFQIVRNPDGALVRVKNSSCHSVS
ncbi:MAG: hypothetical protein A3F35_00225 [Candidatus Woykebacteria bacterium RIFCSPHIGHO2_12_FULL_45_10]|uniref:Uncharacterized protein n=1 Tax=Candidatus Woykebacteria bacterium RIFCSPHIGHO2_12_FULL_45_10 TaxID=1802603 RepID=A0A1G1WPS5_9BACT|nr:MAG: hypothetical protein A3F35_00225 [Candidatus Woykebacteria bacterium RIFCSPHIGHO2_12_FULL_45_10]